jgi:hypothetical protein
MNTKITTIAIAAVIVLFGCKKIDTAEQATTTAVTAATANQRAQEWYDEQNRKPKPVKSRPVMLDDAIPEWANTRYFAADNMLITPVQANNADSADRYIVMMQNKAGEIGSGYYCFVLSKDNIPQAGPALLGNSVPQTFSGAIVKYDLDGSLITAQQYNNGTADAPQSKAMTDVYIHTMPHTQN